MTGLYNLDVDDAVWHDRGLHDEDEDDVPAWLEDVNVQKGIKCLLEMDRCKEEEYRLKKERCTLQEWLQEEWACLVLAIRNAGE